MRLNSARNPHYGCHFCTLRCDNKTTTHFFFFFHNFTGRFILILNLSNPSIWFFFLSFFFFFVVQSGLRDLSFLTGNWNRSPAVETLSPNCWNAREFPSIWFFFLPLLHQELLSFHLKEIRYASLWHIQVASITTVLWGYY